MDYNIYCDESNHLNANPGKYMTLGFICCERKYIKKINAELREIKAKYNLKPTCELKWTKVSLKLIPYYSELIDYFWKNDYLSFRAVIAEKAGLDHNRFNQTYDDWYYKMYYYLLGKTLKETSKYNIYIDIKDTCGESKVRKLKEILNKSYYSFAEEMISKIQRVRSHECELLQLVDLIIGCIGYRNNERNESKTKLQIVNLLEEKTDTELLSTTSLYKTKFNLFKWEKQN